MRVEVLAQVQDEITELNVKPLFEQGQAGLCRPSRSVEVPIFQCLREKVRPMLFDKGFGRFDAQVIAGHEEGHGVIAARALARVADLRGGNALGPLDAGLHGPQDDQSVMHQLKLSARFTEPGLVLAGQGKDEFASMLLPPAGWGRAGRKG